MSFPIDPLYIAIGLPAAGVGLVLGVFISWLVGQSRR